MHIAQRKELDVHKPKRKRGRNRTTTSLVLDSSMQRGRWEFRLNQRIWLRLSSVFESRRISFLKIFLVRITINYMVLIAVIQDVNNLESYVVAQDLEMAITLALSFLYM